MLECQHPLSPKKEELALIIIDPQTGVFKAMEPEVRQKVINNIKLLIAAAQKMNISILLTEQYPKGLGRSVEKIQQALGNYQPIEKISFSCCGDEGFKARLKELKSVKSVITSGIETHVCVLQTTLDLLADGYQVYIAGDAVCSRRKLDWEIGLRLMEKAGAIITTAEILIFQLLGKAGTEEFKAIAKLLS